MQIPPRLCDRPIARVRGARSRLVMRFHGNWAVESTIRIAGVGLRLRTNTNAVPSCEEVVYVSYESAL